MKYIKKYKLLLYILLIICAAIVFLIRFTDLRKPKSIIIERKTIVDETVPTVSDEPTIDFATLRKKYNNKDIKGAIRINNEDFEEIVFQSNDNEYYLKHNYRGKKTNGEIFIDSELNIDESDIKVIYGEGSNKSDVFKNYYKKNYYEQHKFIELETDKLIYKYEVLSLIEDKISYKNFDIEKVLDESKYVYNDDIENVKEYLVIINKKENKYYSIICKKVN